MRKHTIKDVAALAGVSPMTVSRVINREPSVQETTQERVLRAIEALNYQPDVAARSLRGTRSFALGLVYDDNPNANYVVSMQKGVLAACRKNGYELLIYPCEADSSKLVDELSLLASTARLAGLVLTPPMSEDAQIIAKLKAGKVPFVRILASRSAPNDGTLCVFVDDHAAAYAITTHLIQLGHTEIAFLWGNTQYLSSTERYRGYADALRDHGIAVRKKFVLQGSYTYEDGFKRARKLLSGKETPTAIFGSNDEIAAGVLAAARSAGLNVPWDLSIAGFEDNPFSRQAWPALTTARQITSDIGYTAALTLIDCLRHKDYTHVGVRFEPSLVVRDSTAPPRPAKTPAS